MRLRGAHESRSMAFTPPEVAELHQTVKNILEIWMRIKLAIQKAFSKGEITREQEHAFLQLKSDLSRLHRSVGERLPKDLQFEGGVMVEMLKNAISMQHLQNQPVTEKRNLFSLWHKVYVRLSRTYGALEVINEGYYPSLHRDKLRDPAKKSTAKSAMPKGGAAKTSKRPV